MNKKFFETPVLEVVMFENVNIIATSEPDPECEGQICFSQVCDDEF